MLTQSCSWSMAVVGRQSTLCFHQQSTGRSGIQDYGNICGYLQIEYPHFQQKAESNAWDYPRQRMKGRGISTWWVPNSDILKILSAFIERNSNKSLAQREDSLPTLARSQTMKDQGVQQYTLCDPIFVVKKIDFGVKCLFHNVNGWLPLGLPMISISFFFF